MIVRNEFKGDLALGKRVKSTVVSGLDTVTEGAGAIADAMTTVRSAIESINLQFDDMNIQQRGENYKTAQKYIKELVAEGASEEEACNYLQVPYVSKPIDSTKPTSTLAQMAGA